MAWKKKCADRLNKISWSDDKHLPFNKFKMKIEWKNVFFTRFSQKNVIKSEREKLFYKKKSTENYLRLY